MMKLHYTKRSVLILSNCHLKNKIISKKIASKPRQTGVGLIYTCTLPHRYRTWSSLTLQKVKNNFANIVTSGKGRERRIKRERGR